MKFRNQQPPQQNPNASLYPWSQRRLAFSSNIPSPFPRYGAAVNAVSSKEGDIYIMGGLINSSTVKGDLWMIEAGGNMTCYPLGTTAEGPGPRVGHSSLLVGNAFIVYGGDTKIDETDVLDETLYLLNTCKTTPLRKPFAPLRYVPFVLRWIANLAQQPPDNGQKLCQPALGHRVATVIPSTSLALRFMFSEDRWKATS